MTGTASSRHSAPVRSLLYVPGDREGWVAKASRSGADAIVIDLEDAVARSRKQEARDIARAELRSADPAGPQLWVRVDAEAVEQDLEAVTWSALHTVLVPKAEPALLRTVDERLSALEAERGLPSGGIGVAALLETAVGLEELTTVARSPRVRRLAIGEADLAAELGLVPGPEREELAPIRSRVVVASAAAGLERPIGPVHTVVDDAAGLLRTCRQQYRQGFRGRTAIHPSQVIVINAEYLPAPEEVASARRLLASFDRAEAAGVSAFSGEDGSLVDPATIRRAREIVAAADLDTPEPGAPR
ncbi:CoA ester lyase [Nocardioides sp. zg-579]|uniref:CoA ester lyase n=1 Tax=Nocardioides marmotae TaxID=2663857 RepID=A0A6I3IYJ2_9ACTN|nr:CoA ester lyase [Nocardioides marmotae]MCR6030511.1 CoA ester lyase [Gordonia jinghuaiqii]MTB94147.1 CoA ester lyase [Nocardioides marmotae]QKE00443.1 CoA ester lyase [Nocardioides marmotae]